MHTLGAVTKGNSLRVVGYCSACSVLTAYEMGLGLGMGLNMINPPRKSSNYGSRVGRLRVYGIFKHCF